VRQTEEHLAEVTVRVFLFLLFTGTVTLAWAMWNLWPSPEGGARAVSAAKTYFSKGVVIGLVVTASVLWQRRRAAPDQTKMRRLFGWVAVAGLVWAAMHMAALAMLPAAV
jgi:DMSO/TMAO reductase YedYZ heme-binding membrane subunit